MSMQPATAPVPALKYQLLPEVRDLKRGNAALMYQRAHAPEWFDGFRRQADYAKAHDWLEAPLDRLPVERAQALLPRQALKEVDLGARRDFCDWEMTERLREEGIALPLPDIQSFREIAMMLALRARIDIREGNFAAAVHSLQTGMAFGRHIAEGPTLITGLVGTAMSNIMLRQAEALIQQDGAPNLYWALTDLPRPFIDLRRPLQAEKMILDAMFPEIRAAWKDPDRGPLSPENLNRDLAKVGSLFGERDFSNRLVAAVTSARVYPEAKKYLIDHGFPAARADALPVIQVALMYALAVYDIRYDDMYRWTNLPYWEARPGLLRAERKLRPADYAKWNAKEKITDAGIPIAAMMLPAMAKVLWARANLDRHIAALRCVEALRLHAAAQDGKFPAALADVKEVPIPIDPMTGKNFEYRLEVDRAILVGSDLPGERIGIRYELTLRRSKS